MKLVFSDIQNLTIEFGKMGLLPVNASETLVQMSEEEFAFNEQLKAAESIHLHIKVKEVDQLAHDSIKKLGGQVQNQKEGYDSWPFNQS